MTEQQADRRHALVFNALTRSLAAADRFVSLHEREQITAAILNALDADSDIIRTDWAVMGVDQHGAHQYAHLPTEREARAVAAMNTGRPGTGWTSLVRRDVTDRGEGEWVTVPTTPEETQAALQDAEIAWCGSCDRWVTRTYLAQHQAERHGGTS